jgi:hypothetical protein
LLQGFVFAALSEAEAMPLRLEMLWAIAAFGAVSDFWRGLLGWIRKTFFARFIPTMACSRYLAIPEHAGGSRRHPKNVNGFGLVRILSE